MGLFYLSGNRFFEGFEASGGPTSGERCLRRRSVNIPLASSDERSLPGVAAESYRRTSVSVRLTGATHSH